MGPVQVADILALVDLSGLERFNGHRRVPLVSILKRGIRCHNPSSHSVLLV
jgi:hypothetical protein